MSNLTPYDSGAIERRASRQTARGLAHLDSQRHLGLARTEVLADLQTARADAVTYVAKTAMQDAAMLSQLEGQLSTLVPLATTRLQAIADTAALGLAEVVSDTVMQLRRGR